SVVFAGALFAGWVRLRSGSIIGPCLLLASPVATRKNAPMVNLARGGPRDIRVERERPQPMVARSEPAYSGRSRLRVAVTVHRVVLRARKLTWSQESARTSLVAR